MKKFEKEKGAASMYMELKDGVITLYFGKSKEVLEEWEAEKGDWSEIWKTIRSLKIKSLQRSITNEN